MGKRIFGRKPASFFKFGQKRAAGLGIFGRKAAKMLEHYGVPVGAALELAGGAIASTAIGAPIGAAVAGAGAALQTASAFAPEIRAASKGLERVGSQQRQPSKGFV